MGVEKETTLNTTKQTIRLGNPLHKISSKSSPKEQHIVNLQKQVNQLQKQVSQIKKQIHHLQLSLNNPQQVEQRVEVIIPPHLPRPLPKLPQ